MFIVEDPQPVGSARGDPNIHVREFLRYYLSLTHSPYYAVLVSGMWGIGKTYLVKSVLDGMLNGAPYSYVSLYGVSSVDEIDSALYQSLHPVFSSKGAKVAGRASRAAMKFVRVDGAIKLNDFVGFGRNRLYVFDDLERSILKPEVVLGYINELVEHDGCKVIIIGNESKLLEIDGYRETREKLIGRLLEVQPEINSAFEHFLTQVVSARARDVMKEHLQVIVMVFSEASSKNFRILQQTIWDFERVINCLDEAHLSNSRGMRSLIGTFFAISFEVKAGQILQADIESRPDSFMRAMMNSRKQDVVTSLDAADKRFSEVDLYDSVLSGEVISELLFKGIVDRGRLRESVSRSEYYVDVANEPAWRTVWHGYERNDVDFDAALIEMERQFKNREILEPGVILHVVGMRMWLSGVGALSISREEGLEQGRNYVTDLYRNKLLVPKKGRSFGGESYQGFGGLGIHEMDSEDFKEFIGFLENMQTQVSVDMYPDQAKDLLNDMESDADAFLRKICFTNDEANIYASVPLFTAVSPVEFVRRVMGLHPSDRRTVIRGLNIRYDHGNLERYIPSEKDWLVEVHKEFYIATESLSPMGRYGVVGALRHYLDPVVPVAKTATEGAGS